MDKNLLLETARQLKQVSNKTSEEFEQKGDQLISKMNKLMMERLDIEKLTGKNNINMMKDNHANHVRFISSILKHHNPDVLVETVLWVFSAYRSHGFTTNYWAAQLNTWLQLFKTDLSPKCYEEIYPLYEWMQINIQIFVKVSNKDIEASNSIM
ncbi:MAG TPA: hypothetical protein VLM44_12800 [Lutibacter sp.]|nr:hypothetical protein [Lutibacter sp.]